MRDKNGCELKFGDLVRIDKVETRIRAFTVVCGQEMLSTIYGDFSPTIVEKITDPHTTIKEVVTHESD